MCRDTGSLSYLQSHNIHHNKFQAGSSHGVVIVIMSEYNVEISMVIDLYRMCECSVRQYLVHKQSVKYLKC